MRGILPLLVSAIMLSTIIARHGGHMKDWGPWDWIAWGNIGISVLFLAIDTAVATLPNFAKTLPNVFQAKALGFIPLAFFALGSCVFLAREIGLISSAKPPAATGPMHLLISDIPSEKRDFLLQLQFSSGDIAPIEVRRENVLTWYALWQPAIQLRTIDKKSVVKDQPIRPKTWTIFIVFDRPSQLNQIFIQGNGHALPPYQVKWVTTVCALIDTSGDFPEGVFNFGSVN